MLNQSSEYALRAVALIASRNREIPLHAKELAAELNVPANYLSKILYQLAAAGVLVSRRGRQGGFLLAAPASRMRLARVVAPFEDLTQYSACLLGRPACSARGACAAHHEWKPIASAVLRFLKQTTVAQLAQRK
jgi:Rrf2 family transcriptional regulator, iron-sulfur cluster assembly transcription factor